MWETSDRQKTSTTQKRSVWGDLQQGEGLIKEYEQISLRITKAIETLMKDRGIQKEDVQKTIYHAETTGEKFINPGADHSLASFRPDRVTYWVEYSKIGEVYEIHTVYSHRTEMKRKGTPWQNGPNILMPTSGCAIDARLGSWFKRSDFSIWGWFLPSIFLSVPIVRWYSYVKNWQQERWPKRNRSLKINNHVSSEQYGYWLFFRLVQDRQHCWPMPEAGRSRAHQESSQSL